MKIRNGFVSNSSSSSFCILGFTANVTQTGIVEKAFKETSLDVEYAINEGDDSKYIGMCPEKMQDNETLRQFKRRIVDECKKLEIDVNIASLGWITDGGYNG